MRLDPGLGLDRYQPCCCTVWGHTGVHRDMGRIDPACRLILGLALPACELGCDSPHGAVALLQQLQLSHMSLLSLVRLLPQSFLTSAIPSCSCLHTCTARVSS